MMTTKAPHEQAQPLRPDLDVICDWMEGEKCLRHTPSNIADAKELKRELWDAGYAIVPREPRQGVP